MYSCFSIVYGNIDCFLLYVVSPFRLDNIINMKEIPSVNVGFEKWQLDTSTLKYYRNRMRKYYYEKYL